MSKMAEIRRAVKDFGGRKFTTTELRNAVNGYVKTNQRLADLEALHEIKRLDMIKTGGRSMREWQEVNINESLMSPISSKKSSLKQIDDGSPWAKVYPEYFQLPNLHGTVRSFCEAV